MSRPIDVADLPIALRAVVGTLLADLSGAGLRDKAPEAEPLRDRDPEAYLRALLTRIADHPVSRVAGLMPWAVVP